ncbi:PREDICTED: abhydrolase domain-containing protein 8 [Mesitornis unicolor]|uniref:abhydrolase domain-containing protein 8 n=1 Tax=Mesitornis unicolor TaxID=54374 RepID=UPI000528B4CC|nr:PREDICTED: abhydrolase domain-containing protein 8 [Mesitornis unicolor]
MLTSITDGLLCCLMGKTTNAVGPLDSVESSNGYSFMEVKPGRILRVRHSAPNRLGPEGPEESQPGGPERGTVHCKRKITVYRNGQLVIENLGDAVRSEILHCRHSGSGEPSSTVELELSELAAQAPAGTPGCGTPGCGTREGNATAAPAKRRKRKPKKVVNIDCKKQITSCKGTHGDVVLFFIHGVGGSLDIWKEQLDFFIKLGYEVVAPDLAGHGCSSAPQIAAAYTFYALAEDMRAIFKRYAKKRNILIGHSYGVSFCTFLAHEYPELVHKVIMINGGGPTALEPSLCSIFNMPTCVLHCLSPCLAWSFLKAGFARQGAKEKQLLKEGNAFNVSSFVLRAMMSGQYWPEGDEVYHAELAVPVLLVHGMHDKFVPVEEDQRMAEVRDQAGLGVVGNAGRGLGGSHMVMMECPETVNTLLHEFILWEPETPAGDGQGEKK